jgi:hypothetical protein
MRRPAHVAGWLAAANVGISLILLGAIASFVEWWAVLALVGVGVVSAAVTGFAVEIRSALSDRARRRARPESKAVLRSAPPAKASTLTPVTMDLDRRPDPRPRKKAQPAVRRCAPMRAANKKEGPTS